MNKKELANLLTEIIVKTIDDKELQLNGSSRLVGIDSAVDSMKLVEICINLEVYAETLDFEFDWTSANAMSKSKSIFRTIDSLIEEFIEQLEGSK
jgi:acyl carrier protein